jgi:hypothetical protein
MPVHSESSELARSERQSALAAFGFAPHQIVLLLEQGVTVEHLRGMLRLKQCEGTPAVVLVEIAARIDWIEELDHLSLDSHTA